MGDFHLNSPVQSMMLYVLIQVGLYPGLAAAAPRLSLCEESSVTECCVGYSQDKASLSQCLAVAGCQQEVSCPQHKVGRVRQRVRRRSEGVSSCVSLLSTAATLQVRGTAFLCVA